MSSDHRRSQILDAVDRLLAVGGLDAVTMRAIAAEAGVSLRLVQYYGKTKDDILFSALERQSRRSIERLEAREGTVETFLLEALPDDDESRALHRVGVSLEFLAVTTDSPASHAYRDHLAAIHTHLEGLYRRRRPAPTPASTDDLARQTMAFMHGLGSLVMTGHTTPEEARASIRSFLESRST